MFCAHIHHSLQTNYSSERNWGTHRAVTQSDSDHRIADTHLAVRQLTPIQVTTVLRVLYWVAVTTGAVYSGVTKVWTE